MVTYMLAKGLSGSFILNGERRQYRQHQRLRPMLRGCFPCSIAALSDLPHCRSIFRHNELLWPPSNTELHARSLAVLAAWIFGEALQPLSPVGCRQHAIALVGQDHLQQLCDHVSHPFGFQLAPLPAQRVRSGVSPGAGPGAGAISRAWCQRRLKTPQKRRSKIPQFRRSRRRGRMSVFWWPAAGSCDWRRCWWRDECLGADMLRHKFGMLAEPVA